ncbi:hypothetical protein D3C74_361070 [compost metagenome]
MVQADRVVSRLQQINTPGYGAERMAYFSCGPSAVDYNDHGREQNESQHSQDLVLLNLLVTFPGTLLVPYAYFQLVYRYFYGIDIQQSFS